MKKNKLGIIIGVLVILIVAVIGISYAWLKTTIQGQKVYILRAGTLNLILDESSSNGINITEAYPMSDSEGLTQATMFAFTLENTGTIDSGYEIYLDDDSIDAGDTRIADSNVKYSLKVNGTAGQATLLSATTDRIITSGTIAAGAKNSYELRLWISNTATGNLYNQVFAGKLRIEAVQSH